MMEQEKRVWRKWVINFSRKKIYDCQTCYEFLAFFFYFDDIWHAIEAAQRRSMYDRNLIAALQPKPNLEINDWNQLLP